MLVDLATPKVMGIINVTPDSFYEDSKMETNAAVLQQAEKMLSEGATFLDIGGYSSRPGADHVSETEELKRILPAIETIVHKFPDALISVDTFRSNVAKNAVAVGAVIVNDISAGLMDTQMLATVAQLQVPYIMMHMKGTPKTMTTQTDYNNIIIEVLKYFSERIALAREAGINDIIADPGFGFSKTRTQSFEMLQNLELFKQLDLPFLVGISRKSMIYKSLDTPPQEALNGTTALHSISLLKGASILRVHDVKEAMECITLVGNLQ
ncbi:MAG: dihydropteroate synthase [Flavobacteriaceae bacterium]|nr:dihydropteroate synthase [Flavobacteriaceae bacterium]